ncbi:MAG: glycosyltransferase family 52 protein [Blautia sp.]|nr:glycosyltransferase family 52 protein [Lachnoclostridium sp.]MCM1212655.1 glycosyltransferase family 52 protein [Blautia sp.]
MKKRIYVCHTYYHVYVACLKECYLPEKEWGQATLVLSTMSNDFGNLQDRAKQSGLFETVFLYEEKSADFFPELQKYHKDRGNILINMLARIKYTKLLGRLQEPYVPVDFREYQDIYVFCDSDPIGYYLSYKKIYYHAVEDGLNCLETYDTARYDNRGHFGLKAWMAARNLIFIQNGYAKYCLDMEVNDISILPYPIAKHIELPRETLVGHLSRQDKDILIHLFIENMDELQQALDTGAKDKILVLSEPLCDLEVRKQIFTDIIKEYGTIDGHKGQVLIKPHPRDVLDYRKEFPEHIVMNGMFPMEIMNFIPGLRFRRVVSVFTVPNSIRFAEEIVFLGEDFMDKYEEPALHRQNEQI